MGLNAALFHSLSRILLWSCLCILSKAPSYSQSQSSRFFPVDQEELSNKFVRCIIKDSNGFIWFGTSEGLCRFDGTSVKVYEHDPKDTASLCHNTVTAIIEDNQHNLWVGTAQGLNLYNREKDRFININARPQNKNTLQATYITALAQDLNGQLWIGTLGGGINIYDPRAFRFSYVYANNTKDNYVGADYIISLVVDGDKIWAGTRGGLRLYNIHTHAAESLSSIDETVLQREVTCLLKGRGQNLWLGTASGEIIELIPEKDQYRIKLYARPRSIYKNEGQRILAFCNDPSDNLWIAAENSGINYLETATNKITQFLPEEGNNYSIGSSAVRTTYIDDHGMVWIGTYDKGAYFIDKQSKKFELYQRNYWHKNTLVDDNVKAFAEDGNGSLWIATNNGLNKFRIQSRQLQPCDAINKKLRDKLIKTVYVDSENDLWIGTWKSGVIRVNPKTLQTTNYIIEPVGTNRNDILCIYEDKKKNLWVGTSGSGLFYFDRTQNSFTKLSEKGTPNYLSDRSYVTSILEDTSGTLWVGTLYGLFALKRKGNNTFDYTAYYQDNRPGGLSGSSIEVIYEDEKKNVWIGTSDKGLNLLIRENGTFRVFQKQHGLSSNTIRGILSDAKGNLWISTNAGISKFNLGTHTSKNYFKEDGLNSNNFYTKACLKTASGEFIFGGSSGFNVFYPDSITDNPTPPVMYLTDLKINNQPVKIDGKDSPLTKHIGLTRSISLLYEQRSFIIDFVAINYGPSSHNQYCYMLEGFDDSWNCSGPNNRATYTNVDPGRYVFVAKGSNSDGVWTEVPVKLSVTVHPPFWKTWWARGVGILTLAIIIYILFRIKTERIKIENQLALEKMAREKEHELTLLKMQFFTNISHELRTPLSLIIAPLEALLTSSDAPAKIKEQMSLTYRNARRMIRLVNELMDFRKLDEQKIKIQVEPVEINSFISSVATYFSEVSHRRNIDFTIDAQGESCSGWIDRDKVETILFNLLTNAFKFVNDNGQVKIITRVTNSSPYGTNGIEAAENNRLLHITVVDNGIGISTEELPFIFERFYQAKSADIKKSSGTGIGLALAKGLAEAHHGTISAESIPKHQTRFTVTLPIDQRAYRAEELSKTFTDPADMEQTVHEPVTETAEEVNGHHATEKPKVLLVEDNDELREYLVNELSRIAIIQQARDGQEGVDIALSEMPDLIVSDIVMPRKSGIELCSRLKSDVRTSHIPVILLTARSTIEEQVEGITTGADIYLAKPFSIRILKAHIIQLTDLRRKLYAMFSQDVYMMPARISQNKIDQDFLQKAIDHIVQNITDPQLNVEAVADIFNISRSQAYRKIKALTGKSTVELIRTVRLKEALKLMETKRYTLAEVAYQTGFTSPSYFTRTFKEQYGKAPSEFLEAQA